MHADVVSGWVVLARVVGLVAWSLCPQISELLAIGSTCPLILMRLVSFFAL
jgi:hypothetical protein